MAHRTRRVAGQNLPPVRPSGMFRDFFDHGLRPRELRGRGVCREIILVRSGFARLAVRNRTVRPPNYRLPAKAPLHKGGSRDSSISQSRRRPAGYGWAWRYAKRGQAVHTASRFVKNVRPRPVFRREKMDGRTDESETVLADGWPGSREIGRRRRPRPRPSTGQLMVDGPSDRDPPPARRAGEFCPMGR